MTPEEFRAALKDLGMRQNFLARAAGISPTTVNRWAKGTQPIPGWVEWVIELSRENAITRARLAAFGIPSDALPWIRPQGEDTRAPEC